MRFWALMFLLGVLIIILPSQAFLFWSDIEWLTSRSLHLSGYWAGAGVMLAAWFATEMSYRQFRKEPQ